MRKKLRATLLWIIVAVGCCVPLLAQSQQLQPARPVTESDVVNQSGRFTEYLTSYLFPRPQWAHDLLIVAVRDTNKAGSGSVIESIEPGNGATERLTSGDDPHVDPSGRVMAFFRGFGQDRLDLKNVQLFTMHIVGNQEPHQVTHFDGGVGGIWDRQLAWSSDSRHVALLTSPGLPGKEQVTSKSVLPSSSPTVEVEGGGSDADGFSWPRKTIRVLDVASGSERVVYDHPVEVVGDLGWIPSKNALLFNPTSIEYIGSTFTYRTAVDEIDLTSGRESTLLEKQLGGQGTSHAIASPDGSRILFNANPWHRALPDRFDLSVLESNGTITRLAVGPFVSGAVWDPDGRAIYGVAGSPMLRRVFRIGASSDATPTFVDEDAGVDLSPSPSKDGKWLAWIHIDLLGKVTLRVENLQNHQLRDLLTIQDPLKGLRVAAVRRVTWTAADGLQVAGLLFTPPSFDRSKHYPMIVGVHGGEENGLSLDGPIIMSSIAEAHYWAGQGYVVFEPDYRTSQMYGPDVIEKMREQQSRYLTDANDVLSGVDEVCRKYSYVDCTRLVLTGQSWGGAYATFILTQDHRFKAAVISEGLGDSWENAGGDTEEGLEAFYLVLASKNADAYDRNSSVVNARKIDTPTMFMQSENGGNSAALHYIFETLQTNGIPSVRLFYRQDAHVLQREANRYDFLHRARNWFLKYAPPNN